jgi:hypothetical protein
MFQVNAINCVVIRAMHVNNHLNFATAATFNVYKKSGALLLSDTTDRSQWTMIGNAIDVTLLPRNEPSPLPEDAFTAVRMVTRTDGGFIGYNKAMQLVLLPLRTMMLKFWKATEINFRLGVGLGIFFFLAYGME